MFKRILIANRGEIAVRIIRACKKMGIESVIYYSKADKHSLPVKMADFAICIEPPKSQYSYLNMHTIISAAKIAHADAIHPGYGFLSENYEFAELCRAHGFVFIGPNPETIKKMGDKILAKKTMKRNGVPVIPGSNGEIYTIDTAVALAEELIYPVIVKAVAGGGGRGMRIAHNKKELKEAFYSSQAESKTAFGSTAIYLEKFFTNSRHIEFQVLADSFGNIVHLGERDCSTQRRYQKLIEESPSPSIHNSVRRKMGEMAVRAVEAVEYQNAGTVEFLVDEQDNFYFMEMNTRLQVEHPVTEMVTGIDIVEQQIKIAAGRFLSFSQADVEINGHAIECRINAEDPLHDFMPSPGKIDAITVPSGDSIRFDSHVYTGYEIPLYYDSLIGKLIVHGLTRQDAIQEMIAALEQFRIRGIDTTIPFHKKLLTNEVFWEGRITTNFVERLCDTTAIGKPERKRKPFGSIHYEKDEMNSRIVAYE